MKDVKDIEFAMEMEEVIDRSSLQPERLNAKLDLKMKDCSKDDKFAEFIFEVKEWCRNPYGGVHGGIISAVFDTTMGMGAVGMTKQFVTTTDISVSFLRAMNADRYIFRIDYTQVGKRLVRCIGKAIDAETGEIAATAMASFMTMDSKPKGIQV